MIHKYVGSLKGTNFLFLDGAASPAAKNSVIERYLMIGFA